MRALADIGSVPDQRDQWAMLVDLLLGPRPAAPAEYTQLAGDVVPLRPNAVGIEAMSPEIREAYREIWRNATINSVPMRAANPPSAPVIPLFPRR